MGRYLRSVVPVVGTWLTLAAVIHLCHLHLASVEARQGQPEPEQIAIVPNAYALKLFSLGYDHLLADICWLAFIQYYGDTEARIRDRYKYAYAYLELITRLDPKFTQPYWFAAFAVGAEMKRPDLAARLIERGVDANQELWYLPFIAGINQHLFAGNDAQAAKYYRRAARCPGSPAWLERQACILEAGIPSLVKESTTWTTIYLSSSDRLVRKRARVQVMRLWREVYRRAPSENLRLRAAAELELFGSDGRSLRKSQP